MTFRAGAPTLFSFRERKGARLIRRSVDIVLVALALPVILAVLALASVAIVLEDGFPVVFKQRRVGRYERLFTIYKLRTMFKADCGDGYKPAHGNDARITRVGSLLRKLSIDELPQLFNILKGDMTLIGPRPEMPFIVHRYAGWQHMRHFVTPGLTCIWQTECRSTVPLHKPEATNLDLLYIRTQSPLLDTRLFAKTIVSLVSTKGAM